MEEEINKVAESIKGGKRDNQKALTFIRYADDFVVLHPDYNVICECFTRIQLWLEKVGLELKPSKTRIGHTLQMPNTLIKPTSEAIKKHYDSLCRIIDSHRASAQVALINRLNPVIRGWANYYSTQVSKETYAKLDCLIFQKLQSWAKRRHPRKSKSWISKKYWGTIGGDNWVFMSKDGITLVKHTKTKIVRHVKVKGTNSPFDGNLVYWSTRMGNNPLLPKRVTTLLKRQKGKCTHCGLHLRETDVMEVDHIIPKSKGGKDAYKNLQLLHRHCHHKKTATDG